MYISSNSGLSLTEYTFARDVHCSSTHTSPCSGCSGMLKVARTIIDQGFCSLHNGFNLVSPEVKYTAEHARRKLPIISVRIGDPKKGNSLMILMEKFYGTNYPKLGAILNGLVSLNPTGSNGGKLQKSVVNMLLSIAQSDSERKCLRYAIYSASGMTPTEARPKLGLGNMKAVPKEVEEAVLEIQSIREAISDLASVEDKALLYSLGIAVESNTSSSESDEDSENDEPSQQSHIVKEILSSSDDLHKLLENTIIGLSFLKTFRISCRKMFPAFQNLCSTLSRNV